MIIVAPLTEVTSLNTRGRGAGKESTKRAVLGISKWSMSLCYLGEGSPGPAGRIHGSRFCHLFKTIQDRTIGSKEDKRNLTSDEINHLLGIISQNFIYLFEGEKTTEILSCEELDDRFQIYKQHCHGDGSGNEPGTLVKYFELQKKYFPSLEDEDEDTDDENKKKKPKKRGRKKREGSSSDGYIIEIPHWEGKLEPLNLDFPWGY